MENIVTIVANRFISTTKKARSREKYIHSSLPEEGKKVLLKIE